MISLLMAMSHTNVIIVAIEAVLIAVILVINIMLGCSIKKRQIKYKADPYIYIERVTTTVIKPSKQAKRQAKREAKEKRRLEKLAQKEQKQIEESQKQEIIVQRQEEPVHEFLTPETPMFEQVFYKKTEAPEEELELEDESLGEIEGKITFEKKLALTTVENKVLYNTLKNYILEYKNIKSRVVNGGEYFRYPGKQIIKIILIGKVIRMAISLDAKNYDYNVYHQKDRSNMKKYQDTPMFVKVNSRLGLLRAEKLIDDCMQENNISKKKTTEYIDYARILTDEVLLKEQENGNYPTMPIE